MQIWPQQFPNLLGLNLSNFRSESGSELVIMSVKFSQDNFLNTCIFKEIKNDIEIATVFDQFKTSIK